MKYKCLLVERKEFDLLKRILSLAQHDKNESYKKAITALQKEMAQARLVSKKELPDDVIRFNSFVTIKTPYLTREYQLVAPDKSDISKNRISILAPMGLALFGYAKGDDITWQFPTGEGTIKIIDVIQKK